MHIFPNPTNDFIHINLGDFAGKKGTVAITNSLGIVLQRKAFSALPSVPATFDMSGFIGGMYLVSIKVEGHRGFTKQFVVSTL